MNSAKLNRFLAENYNFLFYNAFKQFNSTLHLFNYNLFI